MFFINILQIMQVKRTFGIDTFVDTEELAVFLRNEGMAAIRATEADGRGDDLTGRKSLSTDFTQELTISAVVVIDIKMWSTAERTDGIFGDCTTVAALDWFDRFAVLPKIVF